MEQEEILMYQGCPYSRIDESRNYGGYGYKPYGWNGYGYPNFYGYSKPYYGNAWQGHQGWNRDYERNEPHDEGHVCPNCGKPVMPIPTQPMTCPMQTPVQPVPIKPIEKNYTEFKSLEQNVNLTEINNTIINIEQKHPYMMKKLLMMGIAYEECKKIIYLALLCSGKFGL